jgi:hypothetical protein
MGFIVRTLTEQEARIVNIGAHGIPESGIPNSPEWPYAIDETRNSLFTQLRGTSAEMRDGCYFYVLLWRGKAAVFLWECGRLSLSKSPVNSKLSQREEQEAAEIGKEALAAINNRTMQPLIIHRA